MSKSAQQKFNEYLDESRETSMAVSEFTSSSFENYGNYAHAAGYLESVVKDLIGQLPRAKRADLRQRFLDQAQKQKNEYLLKTIKETA